MKPCMHLVEEHIFSLNNRFLHPRSHIFVLWFLVFWSLQLHDFISGVFRSCPSCIAKSKQRLCNIVVFLKFCCQKVTKNHKRKMGWTKQMSPSDLSTQIMNKIFRKWSILKIRIFKTFSLIKVGLLVQYSSTPFFCWKIRPIINIDKWLCTSEFWDVREGCS